MCYMTIISTTSAMELDTLNTSLVQFSRKLPGVPEQAFLRYPNKWFLGARDGCSCGFRHLDHGNEELGFSEPLDWWPEEAEDIEATHQAYEIFEKILKQGEKLDCIDAWTNHREEEPELHGEMVVNLKSIGKERFRFHEGHHFELVDET